MLRLLWLRWVPIVLKRFIQPWFNVYRVISTIFFLLTLEFCPSLVHNLPELGFTACSFLDPSGDFCEIVVLCVTSGPKPSSLLWLWKTKVLNLFWYNLMFCNFCMLKIEDRISTSYSSHLLSFIWRVFQIVVFWGLGCLLYAWDHWAFTLGVVPIVCKLFLKVTQCFCFTVHSWLFLLFYQITASTIFLKSNVSAKRITEKHP